MSWLFPNWENSDEDLIKIFETAGIYFYKNLKKSTGDNAVLDLHILDINIILDTVPTEYQETFFKQYFWYKDVVVKKKYIEFSNYLVQQVKASGGTAQDADELVRNYFTNIVTSYNYDDLMLLYSIAMGIPIFIHAVHTDNIDDYLEKVKSMLSDEEFEELMGSFNEIPEEEYEDNDI